MKFRAITITSIAIAVLALPVLVAAQGPGGFGGHGRDGFSGKRGDCNMGEGMILGPVGDKLDLTDQQRQQIEAILDASKTQASALRDQIDANRDAFRETHQPGQFNEEEVRAFAASQAAIRADLMVIKMKSKADVFAVLTPEQQTEFVELMGLMRETRGQRGRHGRR